MIAIKKGIVLPIQGGISNHAIETVVDNAPVGILGDDYVGLKPTMKVSEGDTVSIGQALFEDKTNPGVTITSSVCGKVIAINRGERRRLLSVVIQPEEGEALTFASFNSDEITSENRAQVVARLSESGMWSLLRTRPYDKIPALEAIPNSIFINTMDSNPLAIDPMLALQGRDEDFCYGAKVMQALSGGAVHLCHRPDANFPDVQLEKHAFTGIHPVGLVGTHIHFIDPVGEHKQVWHLDLQSLLAIGQLFRTGTIDNHRLIALCGPSVKNPKIVRVVCGANITSLLQDNLTEGENRLISGSVFAGRQATEGTDFVGIYDRQVVALPEFRDEILLEFIRPGLKTFSCSNAYLGKFVSKDLPITTSLQGSPRTILPFGIYEKVMPLDILPTLLLKALSIKDTESGVQLGMLELVEEDIALLTYVDPGKHDFGAILRENLTLFEQEG